MKKIFYLICLFIFSLSLSSCGVNLSNNTSSSIMKPSSGNELSSLENIGSKKFNNPFIKWDMPDPCIYRADDGYYYIYSTQSNQDFDGDGNSELVYIPIIRSLDMINFEYVGSVFKQKPMWSRDNTRSGVWAPDVIFYNNQYYCYYTLGLMGNGANIKNSGIGVATSDYPYGPWTDHGKLFDGYDCDYRDPIDQCVRQDEDGKLYLFFGSFTGIYYYPLTENGLSIDSDNLKEDKKLLIGNKNVVSHLNYEAIYICKLRNNYFAFASCGSCCEGKDSTYHVVCFKSESLLGPYYQADGLDGLQTKRGELVIGSYDNKDSRWTSGNKMGNVAGPGHNAVFKDDKDNYYILYHGIARIGDFKGRILFYDPLHFDENGFPHVEDYTSSYGVKQIDSPYIDVNKYISNFPNNSLF